MKKILTAALALTLLAGTGSAFAQGHDDHRNNNNSTNSSSNNNNGAAMRGPAMQGPAMAGPSMNGPGMRGPGMQGPSMAGPSMGMTMHRPSHPNWHQGGKIARSDWGRGRHVDYRSHHLRQPPRGYEWRQVDDNYVLAAVATGLIASILLASH